jgi:arylsulfatase A-like enzyme/Flp pilus assembly protein TadD
MGASVAAGIVAESVTIQPMRLSRSRADLQVCLVTAFLAVAACTTSRQPPPPQLPAKPSAMLIVTIDTLRADRVGVYGAKNIETPNIDRLAREGAWALQADVHVPLTRPSHVSLFTGRYPAEHGVRDNVSPPVAADVPLFAETFRRAGWRTAAFVASIVLDRQSGLARGFDVYSDQFEDGADRRTGDRVVAEAVRWIGQQLAPPKPEAKAGKFVAWVHLYDPHAPYTPPEPYASRYVGRPYDGTVAWSDELIGRLVDPLRQAGALDGTLVVVTSDHGEALGDHGEDVHGYFVYESTLRVPLVLRGPGVAPGTILKGVVRTVDLYPTILELTGVDGPAPTSGRSLAAALTGSAMTDVSSYAESLVPLLHYGWSDLRAVRDGRWKYILAPKPELYDLDSDPGEQKNLVDREPGRANALRAALKARLQQERPDATKPDGVAGVPPEVRERLGALGYVGPGGNPQSASSAADPKDKLEEYKALSSAMQDALIAMRASRHADAVARLHDVEKRGVDSYEVHYYLGRAYGGLRRWREAGGEYEQAVRKLPGGAEAWRGLGESRVALGDSRGAVPALQRLVALTPGDAVARMELGEALRDVARYDEAARVIRDALSLDPRPAQYWHSLGTVLGASGDIAGAERAFNEAVSREPNNGLYVYNHAVALLRLGHKDEAAVQMNRAAALGYRPR